MEQIFNREEIKTSVRITGSIPDDQAKLHKGTQACVFLSTYIFDVFMSIKETGTPQQKQKYLDLEQAYINIVNDLSHVYRIEMTVDEYQYKCAILNERNKFLESENEKLLKTLEFSNS